MNCRRGRSNEVGWRKESHPQMGREGSRQKRVKCRNLKMPLQNHSFMKGVMLGVLCGVLLSFLGNPSSGPSDELHDHHHVRAINRVDLKMLLAPKKLELSQTLKVYCAIMVDPSITSFWIAANETWAKHCDKTVFYTSSDKEGLEAIHLKEEDEWSRVRKALTHAFQNAGTIRWFFLAKATTFAIIENLKYLLLGKNPSLPFYLGRAARSGQLDYIEYNSGVVLSYEALWQLVQAFEDPLKCLENGQSLWRPSLEKEMALCLRYGGVFAENGEDIQGTTVFNSQSVSTLIFSSQVKNSTNALESCCSDLAITFTGMSPNQMQLMMFGVYRLRPYGHVFKDSLIFMPPKGSDND
ncbi:hypothetical protein GJAV_G00131150 [Gymnothorax javanicus]|nr:hypothetical protein GJAV_G00131150 [Gymnothorax javanicus]